MAPAGNIRNTEKLSYDKQHQYEIMVTAFDCGQKRATEDVLVRVEVKPVCKPGWQGRTCMFFFPFGNIDYAFCNTRKHRLCSHSGISIFNCCGTSSPCFNSWEVSSQKKL